jgi:hypothetical protein
MYISPKRIILLVFAILAVSVLSPAHTVTLSWDPATVPAGQSPIAHQYVYRQKNCVGAFDRRAELSPTTQSWIDDSVTPGVTYCYYVEASNKTGKISNPSNISVAAIPSP